MFREAKRAGGIGLAMSQLLLYLAYLRHPRLERNRTDASVYGVSTDGYEFKFVKFTHDGTIKISKLFNVLEGDLT